MLQPVAMLLPPTAQEACWVSKAPAVLARPRQEVEFVQVSVRVDARSPVVLEAEHCASAPIAVRSPAKLVLPVAQTASAVVQGVAAGGLSGAVEVAGDSMPLAARRPMPALV